METRGRRSNLFKSTGVRPVKICILHEPVSDAEESFTIGIVMKYDRLYILGRRM